jgi:hypothetical protein
MLSTTIVEYATTRKVGALPLGLLIAVPVAMHAPLDGVIVEGGSFSLHAICGGTKITAMVQPRWNNERVPTSRIFLCEASLSSRIHNFIPSAARITIPFSVSGNVMRSA